MSKNEKMALWVSAAIGVIVLVWLMIVRRNASSSVTPSPYGPGTIQLAYPTQTPWTASANGLPTVPADMSGGCNSCSRGNGIFNSIGGLLNYYKSKSKDIFDNYQAQVFAAYPDSVTQYFNNPTGANESHNMQLIAKAY